MLFLYLIYMDDEKDKRTFEKIYNSYRKQMTMVALSILHNESDAEDVVHEVFTKIATRHMHTINAMKEEVDVRNYLLKASHNTALNWVKKNNRILLSENEEELSYNVPHVRDDVFLEYICQKMEYERVLSAVQRLEKKYRDVIYYHFVLEIPVPEVAELLGQTLSATKKQLVRGKKKLLYLLETGEDEDGNQ